MAIRAKAIIEFHEDRNVVVTMESGELITGGMIHRANHLMKRESSKQRSAAVFKHRAEEKAKMKAAPPNVVEQTKGGDDLSWLDGLDADDAPNGSSGTTPG